MQSQSRRVPGLDLMKSLGLYLVIFYHITWQYVPDVSTFQPKAVAVFAASTFLSICVPLFFTASGALSLTRPLDLRKNTFRCLHLAVLLLFWTGASLLIVLAIRRTWPGLREFAAIAADLRVGYIQHLWYLPTFLFLTLLLPILHALKRSSQRVWRYSVLLLGVFTFGNMLLNDGEYLLRFLLGSHGHTGVRYFFWYVDFFAYHYWYAPIYLALGAFLLEHQETLARRRKLAVAAIPLCMLALTLFGLARVAVRETAYDPVFNSYSDPFALLLTAAISLLLLTCRPPAWLSKLAASLSRCSLGIYLLHWPILEALRTYVPTLLPRLILSPILALAVLALSWGLTAAALRVPMLKNLFTAAPDWLRQSAEP